jgi:hypothetical protein
MKLLYNLIKRMSNLYQQGTLKNSAKKKDPHE